MRKSSFELSEVPSGTGPSHCKGCTGMAECPNRYQESTRAQKNLRPREAAGVKPYPVHPTSERLLLIARRLRTLLLPAHRLLTTHILFTVHVFVLHPLTTSAWLLVVLRIVLV